MAIHILPINDLKEHEESSTCSCCPTLSMENDEMIFIHNSFDGRESFEEKMINNEISALPNKGNISDGYHTFNELYEHRITLYIALCRQRYLCHQYVDIWRSKLHSDGSCFDGWFVLGIGLKKGEQITYHLPLSRWDETEFVIELPKAPEFDGHTSEDVLERIKKLF